MSQDNTNYNMDSSRGKVDIHKVFGTLFNTSSYQQYSQQYPKQETYNSGFVPVNDPMMNQYSNSTSYDNRFTAVPPSFQQSNPLPPSFQNQHNATSSFQQQSTLPPSFMNFDGHSASAIPPYGNFTNTTIPPYAQAHAGNFTQSNGWSPVPSYATNDWNGQNSEYVYLNTLNPVQQQSQFDSQVSGTQVHDAALSSSGSVSSPSHVTSTSSTPVDDLMSSMSLNPSAPPVDAPHVANETSIAQSTTASTPVASNPTSSAPLSTVVSTTTSAAPISQVVSSSALSTGESQSASSTSSIGSTTQAPTTQASIATPSVDQSKNNLPSVSAIPAPISSDVAPPVLPPNELVLPLPDQVEVPVPPFAEVNATIPPPPPMVQPTVQPLAKPDSSRVAKMHIHTIDAQGGNMLDQIRNGKSGLKHEDRLPASRKSDDDLASTLAGALDARFGRIRKQQQEEEEEDTADEEWIDRSISRRNITAM